MNLIDYISASRGRATELAKRLNVSAAYISQIASGYRKASPVMAVQIEEATNGDVSRKDSRPDDWNAIWPEYQPKNTHESE